MPLRGFDQMDSRRIDHKWRMFVSVDKHSGQMALCDESGLAALFLLRSPGFTLASHSTTSVQHGQQIGCDFVNGPVPVDTMENATFIVPGGER